MTCAYVRLFKLTTRGLRINNFLSGWKLKRIFRKQAVNGSIPP